MNWSALSLTATPETIEWALLAATGLAGLGVLTAILTPARVRAAAVGACTAAVGAAGVVTGAVAMAGARFEAELASLLPLAGVRLGLDALGGLFVAIAGAVVVIAALYGIGYAGHGHGPGRRGAQAVLPLFAWGMLMVPCAASVSTFLVLWEMVAVASLLLVVAEHGRRQAVAVAGWWYAAMTQAGFVAILLGLCVYAATAGGETFAALRTAQPSPAVASLVFLLTFAGFGAKAGLVPAHVWLPKAHPEAPSPVSAMLSAAMVNLGAYGVIRVGFDLLGGGPQWWWLVALTAGAASALYGTLQAVVATDLKRLLAYSTVENMGLVFVGIGTAGIASASVAPALAAVALAAALLHVVNHAAFKALLFSAAGSVLRATGTRDLDALGGLRSRMPATTALFAVGALGAAALPPGNGFVSEWLLLQSLVGTVRADGVVTAIAMPLAVAVVALTAGLAVATFVKALGVGFFARPRSAAASGASESPATMVLAMALGALACFGLALVPGALGPALSRATLIATPEAADAVGGTGAVGGVVSTRVAGIASSLSPLVTAAALVAATVITVAAARLVRLRVKRRTAIPLWACGAGPPTERMQYTATSFAEPLQRVFDDVLAPQIDVDVTPYAESRYLVERVAYERRVPDRIEHRLYQPVISALRRVGRLGPVLGNGSVHRYLGYGFLGVTSLLIVLAVIG